METPDSKLVRRVLDGDRAAFDALDARYRDVAHQLALHVVGYPFEADDVVQEAMVRAFTRMDQLSEPSRFGPWLASIVRSVALDSLRRRHRRKESLAGSEDLSALEAAELLPDGGILEETEPGRRALERILPDLTPALSEVVTLRVLEGLHLTEIAARLGMPLGTVKRRLHDARRRIRRLTMKTFDEKAAWEIVDGAAQSIRDLPQDVRQDIVGVAVSGDLVRGDFIPNNSNLLVLPLIRNRKSLFVYDTPAYKAVVKVFDEHCRPYLDCAEAPSVWENLAFDEIHLPTSAESFDPPTIPQPQWHSMFLFDFIDHHHVVFGEDFAATLYRPDPRRLIYRMAAETMRIMRAGTACSPSPRVQWGTVIHWQVVKMMRVIQIHFAPDAPTIAWQEALSNYRRHVPEFSSKDFGEKVWRDQGKARYPVDRKEFSAAHVDKCSAFVEEACRLLAAHRHTSLSAR